MIYYQISTQLSVKTSNKLSKKPKLSRSITKIVAGDQPKLNSQPIKLDLRCDFSLTAKQAKTQLNNGIRNLFLKINLIVC